MTTSPSREEREFFNVPVAEVQHLPDGYVLEYPPLMPSERLLCKLVSKGLFLSRWSLEWGVYDALDGNFDRLNKIAREKVYEQKPLELVKDGPGTLRRRAGKKASGLKRHADKRKGNPT